MLGRFEFDIGAAYYYYPGEIWLERSNYWEAHATMAHKLTEKLTLGATLAYAPDVWQTGAWGTYAAGALALDLPNGPSRPPRCADSSQTAHSKSRSAPSI